MKFVLATANPDKAAEIVSILGPSIELMPRPPDVPDVEETGKTLVENARLKAAALAAATGLPAIADDTGLEVDALDGAPGVQTARFAGEGATYAANVARLLKCLAGKGAGERAARFRTVALARWPDGREVVAEGSVAGTISEVATGEGGFGYDPVFVPDEGSGRSFAELASASPALKHQLSHRGRAFRALADLLEATAE